MVVTGLAGFWSRRWRCCRHRTLPMPVGAVRPGSGYPAWGDPRNAVLAAHPPAQLDAVGWTSWHHSERGVGLQVQKNGRGSPGPAHSVVQFRTATAAAGSGGAPRHAIYPWTMSPFFFNVRLRAQYLLVHRHFPGASWLRAKTGQLRVGHRTRLRRYRAVRTPASRSRRGPRSATTGPTSEARITTASKRHLERFVIM